MASCIYAPEQGELVSSLLGHIDCLSRDLGEGGYRALAGPGSSGSAVLLTFLTIAVALYGLRLMLGPRPNVRELVSLLFLVGVVLTLSSSWQAFRTVVYDVVLLAPEQVAAEIVAPVDLPGGDGSFRRRLDAIDSGFEALQALGVGAYLSERGGAAIPVANIGTADLALGAARSVFLVGSVGGLVLLKLAGGIFLALAPLFASLLLLPVTRGLFVGWIAALSAIMIGTVAIIITLAVELTVLQPWLTDLLSQRAGGASIVTAATPLFATASIFALAAVGMLAASFKVAYSLSLPIRVTVSAERRTPTSQRSDRLAVQALAADPALMSLDPRSRAGQVASSILANHQRQQNFAGASMANRSEARTQGALSEAAIARGISLGQGARRTSRRLSASAQSRDRRR